MTAAELIERVQAAASAGAPLCIRAGGTKDWLGDRRIGDVIDVSPYRGIVDYDPAELVITSRCGTPLAELEATLATQNQMLACEPPHFGATATVGGCVAAGLSGPRRAYAGSIRDFLLGAALLDGHGNILRFGGRVMKNVAGYDVARLLAGSLGILGIVLDVSLKVVPRPAALATLVFECDEVEALQRLNTWAGQPLPLSGSIWESRDGVGVLCVRLSGVNDAVQSACAKLGGERMTEQESDRHWRNIRDHRLEFFSSRSESQRLWRFSVPSTAPRLDVATAPLIEWGGAQRWYVTSESAEKMRQCATAHGGHAVVFRHNDEHISTFEPLSPSLHAIHQRLKATFDPSAIFNRGRMFASL